MAKVFDSTALIDILEGKSLTLRDRFDNEVNFTTHINMFELLIGVYALKTNTARRLEQAEQLLSRFNMLELTDAAVRKAAQIQGSLYRQGKPITDADCLIAAIALVNGIKTIVTRNKKHFESIKELTVETY